MSNAVLVEEPQRPIQPFPAPSLPTEAAALTCVGQMEPNLMITTRMRDTAFKRVLKAIPLQTQVKIEGPFGNLTLRNNAARPAVLLAGGIGITPFRSIVFAAAKEKLPHRIFLVYSKRRPEDAPFLDGLQSLETENPNYLGVTKVAATVSGPLYADFRDRYVGRAKWKSEIPG